MACYHPLLAYRCSDGDVVFCERSKYDIVSEISLPCGRCIGCRLERSRQWAVRCMHEAALHKSNCFITLTYDNDHVPVRGQLVYRDFQLFMRRLRKHAKVPIRFFMCGEYGPDKSRPHFHACIFGYDFGDKSVCGRSAGREDLYRSAELESLWRFGFSSVGDLSFRSAAYVARYCISKFTGPNAKLHYARMDHLGPYQLEPEFAHMSLKPGIGARFLQKFESDFYTFDYAVVNGRETRMPRFYDKQFARSIAADRLDTRFEEIQWAREQRGRAGAADNTPARLAAKEEVSAARAAFLRRSLC